MEIKIHCKHDELVEPKKLKNHPKNRNRHGQDQIDRLAELYKFHGFRHPIIVSKLSNQIVAGHGRKLAAIRAGIKKVPVVYQTFKNAAAEYAFLQSDNAIALWAELDRTGIKDDIADLGTDFDIKTLGLKDFEMTDDEEENDKDPDQMPEVVKPRAKLGQIFKLGPHRLMCGDSTDPKMVGLLMNGGIADMVFTDPPYGVSYTGGLQDSKKGLKGNAREMIKNDDVDLYEDAVKIAAKFCNGPVFMFYADTVPFGLYRGIESVGGQVVALLIWKKKGGYGALGASYKPNHEPCVLWKLKNNKLNFIGSTTENRVWEEDKEFVNKLHPTQKPVAIPERAIKNHKAATVLDLFGGSGSTLIACEKNKRQCFMMELDPKYVDVIIARWEQYTSKKAELING